MNNRPECLPCCLRRVLYAADKSTADEWLHRKILGEAMQNLSRVDDKSTPAEVIHGVIRRIGKTLGVSDPYADEKRLWVSDTLGHEEWIRSVVRDSDDPLRTALHLSAAANILDCELRHEIVTKSFTLKSLVEGLPSTPLVEECLDDFRRALDRAGSILFVHDSAGELLFDRILIEQLGKDPSVVTSVVRDAPILAHATREDAEAVNLGAVAQVMTPGIDCLGVPLHFCSTEFRDQYSAADLIVAKGQACLETLEGKDSRIDRVDKEIFFLLRVKCPLMARHLGVRVGDCVLEMG